MENEWLKNFKVSFVNEDIEQLIKLTNSFDEKNFKNLEELTEASSLILQTITLFKDKKLHLENEFVKLKNARKYAI